MAHKLIDETLCPYTIDKRKEFICDTDADFETLPKCCTGNTAVSLESGTVKVVNTQGEWVTFGEPVVENIVGTWQFNSALTRACPSRYSITFTTNNSLVYDDGTTTTNVGNSFVGMFTPYATVLYFLYGENGNTETIGISGGFSNGFDGVIHITGGDDIANEEFITWLKENATKVG